MSAPRLDPGPALAQARLALLESDQAATVAAIADLLDLTPRSVHRYRAGANLRPYQADRIAVRLNLHPLNLWPEWNAA